MRGLLLAAACVYASRSNAPAMIRAYFDIVMVNALMVFGVLTVYGDISWQYRIVYIVMTIALLLAGLYLALMWAFIHHRAVAVYLLCCALGVTAGAAVLRLGPASVPGTIMSVEGGAFTAMGLLMAVSIRYAPTRAEALVAIALALAWLSKAALDFAIRLTDFSPDALRAGAILPCVFFMASAITVGWSFRQRDSAGVAELAS